MTERLFIESKQGDGLAFCMRMERGQVFAMESERSIRVVFEDGNGRDCPVGMTAGALMDRPCSESGFPYIGALVNNDVCSLSYPLTVNSEVRFLTLADPHGWRLARRSLCFVLAKAVREVYPKARFSVDHSFGPGLYCSFGIDGSAAGGATDDILKRLDRHMRELAEKDVPVERRKIAYMDAMRAFERSGQHDKSNLLKHRNPPHAVLHWCAGFSDLAHGPLIPSTGVLPPFRLIAYPPGFVLHLPTRENPRDIEPFEDQPHLFQIFKEHKEWGKILGVNTAGRLNELIARGESGHFIRTAEALHEKKISRIADRICAAKDRIRVVLIAGPSCAGKTTFAKRLTTHLVVNGLAPSTLSTDNYFVGKEQNPLDEDGEPDFEHIEAVDLALFNEHLLKLIGGETIELPRYNFGTKQREYRGETLRAGPSQPIVIEGIHALNPLLTRRIPDTCTFGIYVNALTQLSLDSNNRLSTTDNRLMRRIVRDHLYRGHSPLETLRLWPSVRRGEKRWIFPFQGHADATFNSALDYEFAALKPLVDPLLMQIKPAMREYAEARRLSEFLLNFLPVSDRDVPSTSILREYIGGSTLNY